MRSIIWVPAAADAAEYSSCVPTLRDPIGGALAPPNPWDFQAERVLEVRVPLPQNMVLPSI